MIEINKLINQNETYAHSHILKIFGRYYNKAVVTSYIKNDFGIAFLIKGKVKGFAFVKIKSSVSPSYYNTSQLNLNSYFKLRAEVKDKTTIHILDEEAEESIKAKCMLNELQRGN